MKLRLHPLCLSLVFVLFLMGLGLQAVIYFLVVLFHELGHYLVSRKLGYTLPKLYLLPYGVCLSYNNECFTAKDEILIALAGPFFNLILCVTIIALWWVCPVCYSFTYFACFASLITMLFNLLPIYPLDGGRVLKAILRETLNKKKCNIILKIINIIFSILFFILFIISIFVSINFNYLIITIIIISGIFEFKFESKYELNKSKKNKRLLAKGSKIYFIMFSSNVFLYKIKSQLTGNKTYKIIIKYKNGKEKIYNENQIDNLLIKYGAKATFENCM